MTRSFAASLAVLAVAALSLGAGSPGARAARPSDAAAPPPHRAAPFALVASTCPPGELPDGDSCIRPPTGDEGAPESESAPGGHRDRRGRWVTYDQIPRRPERPPDYDAYIYPVPCDHGCVVSGYDLDRPDELQRRGRRLRYVGHGAVDLPQPKGTPIRMVPLEHQQGDAEVLFVGDLFGLTVVTRNIINESGLSREYVMLFGHLDSAASGLRAGSPLAPGAAVGTVGDTGSLDLVHLHLEVRRVRDGVDPEKLAPAALIDDGSTIPCDPRNVLPLR